MPTSKARIVTTLKPGVNHIVEQLGGGSGKDAEIPLSAIVSTLVEEALEHRGLFKRPDTGPNSSIGGLSLRLTKLAEQKDMVSHPVGNPADPLDPEYPYDVKDPFVQLCIKGGIDPGPLIKLAKEKGYVATKVASAEEVIARARPLSSAPVEGEEPHYQPTSVAADMEAETMSRASEMIAETVHLFVEKQRAARSTEAARAQEAARVREPVI